MKTAVVIVNLGTPAAPTKKAVAAFLREFLSDPRVVEVPRLIWWLILNGIIIPFRTSRVSKAYQQIWTKNGSPLRNITENQAALLQQKLQQQLGESAPVVRHAMTYSGPSLNATAHELVEEGIEHILVLPLYPQYSATTTGSVYDQVSDIVSKSRNIPQIHVIKQYYDHPLYIESLVQTVRESWSVQGKPERLLMSFHGIPERNCDLGDPYFIQCKATATALAEKLQLAQSQWLMSFQSRLGKAKWLSPYTVDVVTRWGEEKISSVDVICPAFAADCLETLEEIKVENRNLFLKAGGGRFTVIPCLNDHPSHIEMMAAIVKFYLPT